MAASDRGDRGRDPARRLGQDRREGPRRDPAARRHPDPPGGRHRRSPSTAPTSRRAAACTTSRSSRRSAGRSPTCSTSSSGASFEVARPVGDRLAFAARSSRCIINADGTMTVKLFEGQLVLDGKNHVHDERGQQATVEPDGNVGTPGPILPTRTIRSDPRSMPRMRDAGDTTPGTEQDFIGAPLHNGEEQTYTYSYAGGGHRQGSPRLPRQRDGADTSRRPTGTTTSAPASSRGRSSCRTRRRASTRSSSTASAV